MGTVYVGTSGYSYSDWVGSVYPPGSASSRFLELYAAEFAVTELNFSYYAMPRADQLVRMADRTPDGFLFAIKAHKSMTHDRDAGATEATRRFKDALTGLTDRDRLAAVLLQFPFSFHYETANRRYLDRLCQDLEGLPVAVEFRNAGWQQDKVSAAFRQRGLTLVNVDGPDLPQLPEPTEMVTSDLAYLRLHGRNAANWWTGDNVSRYDYLYNNTELGDWVTRIRRILRSARTLIVAFNNHFRGQAVQNARVLKELLRQGTDQSMEVR